MAASMILAKKAAVVDKLRLFPLRCSAAAAISCSFTSSANDAPIQSDERHVDVARRRADAVPAPSRRRGSDLFPSFFGDVFDPFNPRRSLSDVFNLVDQMLDFNFPVGAARPGGGMWRGWEAREDENALYLKVEMPGLGKEDVRVTVEQNTLVIKGEEPVEEEEGSGGREGEEERRVRRYSSRIELPANQYDAEQVRAEMKNGVLQVVVPKVKEQERDDVRHVPVE